MTARKMKLGLTRSLQFWEPDRVTGWLEDLHIDETDDTVGKLEEDEVDPTILGAPTTPQKQLQSIQRCEEVSPTDTSFSNDSNFDVQTPRDLQSNSLGPSFRIYDEFSDTDSIHGCEERPVATSRTQKATCNTPAALTHSKTYEDVFQSRSEKLHTKEDVALPLYAPSHDPSTPRLVCITSCLQCTLTNLPCSRTPPSCSRCRRKGQQDICLLQRRKFPEEMISATLAEYTTPKLLRLRDEEEQSWNRKMAVHDELMRAWEDKQNSMNWVMPEVDSPRKGWSKFGRGIPTRHPGEGKGEMDDRVVYRDLVIAPEL
ncbi:hypothetical protein ACN47E_008032 [Coniothyrium glycines]